MSASCVDALLEYVIRTVEAKRIVEEEVTEIERAHDSLLKERLEKEREWLEELEGRSARLKQREEEQDSDCPRAIAVEQQPELSIPSTIGTKPSQVESPPHTASGVERSAYRTGWEQTMQSEFEGHKKTEIFSRVDRVPEGRKPVGSKWYSTIKHIKIAITNFNVKLFARGFT